MAFRGNGAKTNYLKYGDRAPAIFYNKAGFLRFSNAVDGDPDFYFDYPIDLNRLYHIEIIQREEKEVNGQVGISWLKII